MFMLFLLGFILKKMKFVSAAESFELNQLLQVMAPVVIGVGTDRWVWELDSKRVFSIRSIKKQASSLHPEQEWFQFFFLE
ncbi:hypothetical protein HanRHA438_Chr02g0061541 [Helianthus annuus]|nr:hypothetical protein HanRHA438_Chr02g0061541 [Helianthus annuus]